VNCASRRAETCLRTLTKVCYYCKLHICQALAASDLECLSPSLRLMLCVLDTFKTRPDASIGVEGFPVSVNRLTCPRYGHATATSLNAALKRMAGCPSGPQRSDKQYSLVAYHCQVFSSMFPSTKGRLLVRAILKDRLTALMPGTEYQPVQHCISCSLIPCLT
jgi:hypothetical protein